MKSKFYRELKKTHYDSKERSRILKDLKELLDVFGYLLNYLGEIDIEVPQHRYLIGILTNKYILHTHSILRLISGTHISSRLLNSQRTVYDIGSIVVLTRSAIENYLTYFYLFVQPSDEEEELFRFNLFELSGLNSRQWLEPTEPDQIITKNNDKKRIDELKKIIYEHPLYLKLDKHIKGFIKDGKHARLFTWNNLFDQADLNVEVFKIAWSLYSNYAHSEFISQMQLSGYLLDIDAAKDKCDTILNIMFCLTSIFIKDINGYFPEINERYNSLSKDTLEVIDFFNGVGRKELPIEEAS